jgi:hypothetical protein
MTWNGSLLCLNTILLSFLTGHFVIGSGIFLVFFFNNGNKALAVFKIEFSILGRDRWPDLW